MTDLRFTNDVPAATHDAWAALVDKVLKGADFEKTLVGRTSDGLRIEPLYPKAEGAEPLRRATQGPWRVAQRVDHPDAGAANGLALADLEGGADALTLVWADSPASRGFGLPATRLDDIERVFDGVMLDLVSLRLEAGPAGRGAAALVTALAERRGHGLGDLDLDLGLDPIGAATRCGRFSAPWTGVAARLAETFASLGARGFSGRLALADGRPCHEAGGSEAQELAFVMASALAYLRALEAGGHPLDAARGALSVLLVADADEFMTVAKLRALRRLWARVEEACGLDPTPLRLHAETAWRMATRRDPWVNLLRGTMAAFSAGIGGADVVTVLPFTAAIGLPDAFARRLARNTQAILIEEANVWRVADPAAGAGGFEALTTALAEAAWTELQAIEREGGIVRSLGAGAFQRRVAEIRAGRETAVATRRDTITGTSEFAFLQERPVEVLMPAPSAANDGLPADEEAEAAVPAGDPATFADLVARAGGGASLRDLSPGQSAGAEAVDPLPSRRAAEPFERLRDMSDEILDRTGARPKVFLAELGPVAASAARSTFARNAFEAGGIEALASEDASSPEALAEAFRASGARIACLCSSDAIYETHAVAAAEALRGAGAHRVYLAGRPAGLEEPLGRAGVHDYLFLGCDLVALLGRALAGG